MLKKPILKGKFWMQCMSNLHIDCDIEITILKQNEMWQKLETVWEMTIETAIFKKFNFIVLHVMISVDLQGPHALS